MEEETWSWSEKKENWFINKKSKLQVQKMG